MLKPLPVGVDLSDSPAAQAERTATGVRVEFNDVVGDLAGDTSGEAPRSTPLPVLFVLLLLLLVVALAGLEPPEALPAAEGARPRAQTSGTCASPCACK